jgi:hypothetical protein
MPDVRRLCLIAATAIAVAGGVAGAGAGASWGYDPVTKSVTLTSRPFFCEKYPQPLDLELVRVTGLQSAWPADANPTTINLGNRGNSCTGSIGRIEVYTELGDAIKIGAGAHDLTIGSVSVEITKERNPVIHSDCLQVQGGFRVAVHRMYCYNRVGQALFLAAEPDPAGIQDVVISNCFLRGSSGRQTSVYILASTRSGVRNCLIPPTDAAKPRRVLAVGHLAVSPVVDQVVIPGPAIPFEPGDA